MRARVAAAAAVAALTLGAGAGVADARVPPGLEKKGPELGFSCDGMPVEVYGGNGRSFYLADGQKGHVQSFTFTGTFTPHGGTPQTESESQTYGHGPKGGETLVCTAQFSGQDDEGTFVGSVTVTVTLKRR